MKSLIGIWPNAPSMKPSASASAQPSRDPAIRPKNTSWIAAAAMNTGRAPNRSSRLPTTSCAIEAMANTVKANAPTIVATSALPPSPWPCSHPAAIVASPCSRSSKIFGSAKVVAWKMMLEMAAVMNTISDTRSSRAL